MKTGRFRSVAAALLILLAVAGAYALTAIQTKPREMPLTVEVPLTNIITLKVYRSDGRVETYQKVGDPWTQNLMSAISNLILGRQYITPRYLYARDGTAKAQVETEVSYVSGSGSFTGINPYMVIGIGSGSLSPSFYDVDLSSLITLINVTASGVSVTDNGTHIIASYTISYTTSSAVTVQEVGLYWVAADYGTRTYRYYLFARDVLSQPVALAASDVLAVTYTIAFKYNQPPMTYNFAALMFNYLFGLKYYNKALTFTTTDGTATTIADFGTDSGTGSYDNVKEYAKVRFGNGVPSYTAKINDVRSTLATTDTVTIYRWNNETHFWYNLSVGYPFTSAVTISEVAVIIDSIDIAADTATSAKQVLVLYFPLSSPVDVPAGGAVKFTFTIAFRISP